MNKTTIAAVIAGSAAVSANVFGFSQGVPPTTTSCKTDSTFSKVAWGLTVDVEFGGCKCADEEEMEFGPDPDTFADNSWRCQCLDTDLYLSEPIAVVGDAIHEENGKVCGVVTDCQIQAVTNWTQLWNEEVSTAEKARENAKKYARRSMMTDDSIRRAKTLRREATKTNKRHTKINMAGIATKYRKLKAAMISGSISKATYEKGYKLCAQQIAAFKDKFTSRQASIENSWDLTVQRQGKGEDYMTSDLLAIEDIFMKTLAVLNDRYGKKIAYIQSIPIVVNKNASKIGNQTKDNCPLLYV